MTAHATDADLVSDWRNGAPEPCPTPFNAAAYCLAHGPDRPGDKDALIAVDGAAPERLIGRWTFGDVEDAVRRAAGAFRAAGVERGDRVLLLLGDRPEFPFAYFGAIAAGAVATPLSALLSSREVERIAADADAKAAVLADTDLGLDLGGAIRLDPATLSASAPTSFAETSAEDPALLVYTSGSSGAPKGVLHAQRAFWARRMMRAGWHDIGPGDRVMHAGAFNWTYTLGVGLSDAWSVGAAAILNAGDRSPEVWPHLARRWRPTVFAAVPGVYRRVLKYGSGLGEAFESLRHAVTAGEKLSGEILGAWEAATGKPLLEALGMSEVSTYVSASPSRRPGPGFAGWAQPGRRVAVLGANDAPAPRGETGALAVHRDDPGLMLGYWRDRAATEACRRGEWFVTGDLATMRADGAISYEGRADDQMNAQGYRVSPLEVETALSSHVSVAECAAAELPVSDGLSVIAVWVAPREGVRPERTVLEAHLRTRLAAYKMPRAFFLLDELPKSANGKLQRRRLAQIAAERLA